MTENAPLTSSASAGVGGENSAKRKRTQAKKTVIADSGNLDLESYIANYVGRDKLNRLQFISEICPPLQLDCFQLLNVEVMKTLEWKRYSEIINNWNESLKASGKPNVPADTRWIEVTENQARSIHDRLESEINLHKNSSIKESVRMGMIELAEHHWQCGDLENALKYYIKSRDYCTTAKHQLEVCMNIIKASLELGTYSNVVNYAAKAKHTLNNNLSSKPSDSSQLESRLLDINCALALYYLAAEKYRDIAMVLIEAPFVAERSDSAILHNNADIAMFICICGLATFERNEIKEKLIDNPVMKNYLEHVPSLRDLLDYYHQAKYEKMLHLLMEKLQPNLYLDIYLHQHVDYLLAQIRIRLMLQYCSPFLRIDMNTMANMFHCDFDTLETSVVQLISRNKLPMRINRIDRILERFNEDEWESLNSDAKKVCEKSLAITSNLKLQSQLIAKDIIVKFEP